jgi:hypothetical protein
MNSIPMAEAFLLLNINKKISRENIQSWTFRSITLDSNLKGSSSDVPASIAATSVDSGHTRAELLTPVWAPTPILPSNNVWEPLEDDFDSIYSIDDISGGAMESITATSDNVSTEAALPTPSWKPTPHLMGKSDDAPAGGVIESITATCDNVSTKATLPTPLWKPTPHLMGKSDDAPAGGVMESITATCDNVSTKATLPTPLWKPSITSTSDNVNTEATLPTPSWKPTPHWAANAQWLPLSSHEDDTDLMGNSDDAPKYWSDDAPVVVTESVAANSTKASTPLWEPTPVLSPTPPLKQSSPSLSSLSSSTSSSLSSLSSDSASSLSSSSSVSTLDSRISTVTCKRNSKKNIEIEDTHDNKRAKRVAAKSDYDDQHFCKIVADYGYEKIELALLKYKEINGDLLVERNFTVPCSSQWPEVIWGINLGNVISGIKVGTLSYFNRKEFINLGLIVKDDVKQKISNKSVRHNERQLDLISLGLITESK